MSDVVERALVQWGLEGAEYRLVAARENAVYHVSQHETEIALRLHREHYRTDAELRSELVWMAEVARSGLSVPAPIPASNGAFLVRVDNTQVDALTWLSGDTMNDVLPNLKREDRTQLFLSLGREMAKLHDISDKWRLPNNFDRVHWDHDGLLSDAPLWDRFWENSELKQEDQALFRAFRKRASAELVQGNDTRDFGLIHADLVPANVLVDGHALKLIDFDDSGFGVRLFDVATALLKHETADDYPQLQSALINGYHSIRALDASELDLFLALRAVTYVGWNITRMHEEDEVARNSRFIETARRHISRYMAI
ncbi:MAG: phosphotransferase [Pseudomonadota bacterium]